MSNEQFKKAISYFKKAAQNASDSDLKAGAYYNIGSSYLSLKKCSAAVSFFKKNTHSNAQVPQKLKIKTYLSLSQAFLCLKKDSLIIKSLKNILHKNEMITDKKTLLKVLSMISGSYSRIGDFKNSRYYFLLSQREFVNYVGIRKQNKTDASLESMIFYHSGNSSLKKYKTKISSKTFHYIASQQMYLLNSSCLKAPRWSYKSLNQLMDNYIYIYKEIKKKKSLKSNFLKHVYQVKKFVKKCNFKNQFSVFNPFVIKLIRKIKKI